MPHPALGCFGWRLSYRAGVRAESRQHYLFRRRLRLGARAANGLRTPTSRDLPDVLWRLAESDRQAVDLTLRPPPDAPVRTEGSPASAMGRRPQANVRSYQPVIGARVV